MNLKSIAADLGVSASTVSRVISGNKNFSVSADVREKILARVNALRYSPNPLFQSMRKKKNKQISVLIPNILSVAGNSNIAKGVDILRETLLNSGYSVHFIMHTLEDDKVYKLPPWKVAGVVVVDVRSKELIADLNESGIPYVSLNGVAGSNGTAIMTDDYGNMCLALEHLYELGHRRIGYINTFRSQELIPFELHDHHYSVIQRTEAYFDFCCERRMLPMPESRECVHSVQKLLDAGLRQGMTAFITYCDSAAIEVKFLLENKGLRIPDDISLITFNNSWMLPFMNPPISCIEIPVVKMGLAAAEVVNKKNQDHGYAVGEKIVLKGALVERKSTGIISESLGNCHCFTN